MNTARICQLCQSPLPADAPEGICPACLLKAGLGTQSGAPNPSAGKAPPTPAELARHFPHLEIIELIGQGGMGAVYKARQLQLDRLVALKILPLEAGNDPAFAERFAREARALARLNHPNIVAVYDFGRGGDYFYFVMEFVDGVNLRQMEQTQRLTPAQALKIVPLICDALQYAHDEGVVHRDIKPGNILIDKKGRVKIADFGLAKLLGKANTDFALTQSNLVMGTPHYMAPEQMERPLEVDHRADIYSLGVVFYEMLTGDLPIGRFSPPSQKVQMDVRLDEVVLKALENEPQRRYQQASQVKTDVESIAGHVEKLPPTMRRAFGFEYRSQAELFGLPLVHITAGTDPVTGKTRTAKGIIAIGDKARGVVALGGTATGVIAFGGAACGVLAFGGMAVGLIGFGGWALGLLFASGGISIAPYSFGGIALGDVALGGLAFGPHVAAGNSADPVAAQFYATMPLWRLWAWAFAASLLSMPVQFAAQAWARHKVLGNAYPAFARWRFTALAVAAICITAILVAPRLLARAGVGTLAGPVEPARTAGPVQALPVNSAATEILQRMNARYDALTSLVVTGTGASVTVVTAGTTNQTVTIQSGFTVKMARPEFYRIEWTQSAGPDFTNRGAVWNSGHGHWFWMGQKPSELLTREQSLGMATGISGGASHWLPDLFFRNHAATWPAGWQNLLVWPDERVEGVECQVVSGEMAGMHHTLWISRQDSLLKQIRTVMDGSKSLQNAAATASPASDATLSAVLKAVGQEATPEAVDTMRKKSSDMKNRFGQLQAVTITQTFQTAAMNDFMVSADFEYPVPRDSASR